jgi:formylglycine-generating enzyme required for sulfatase activity
MKTEIRIFVSYRRKESRHQTDRLCDFLKQHFGAGQVFQDVDGIPLGSDFRRVLTEQVAGCDVFLAVIGDEWLSIAGKSGARRIDDPGDYVRIEIEAALARNILIIPVLVDNASIPQAEELPESLRELAYRQGLRVRGNPDFRDDVKRLVRGIEEAVSRGQPKPFVNSIGMKLVLIPAGEFLMGSPDSDKDALDIEKPQHRVRITRPFCLGVYEVTQGQYREVTGANPSSFKGSDDLPVEQVSWNDAIAFCNKLSEREGLKAYYQFGAEAQSGGEGYRLPTEAEWEYTCRAGSTTRYSFGDDAASLGEYAWFNANSGKMTHPVGQKRPNAFGLFDMHGNVWEWCWDGYDAACYARSPVVDPDGPPRASGRVIRGGGWGNAPRVARSAYRYRSTPGHGVNYLGFRVARVQSSR